VECLHGEPSLLPNAINEVLRHESPLWAFSRTLLQPRKITGVDIPAGSRVLVLYASANRDEQEWADANVFDIRRNATRHLGFGYGTHACAGQGLARLEMQSMLTALMQQVSRIELAGQPTWALNNIIRCYERLRLRLILV
jgi:cytochrome P450